MSDVFEEQIRETLAEMVAEAPPSPEYPGPAMVELAGTRRWDLAVVAAITVLAVGLLTIWFVGFRSENPDVAASSSIYLMPDRVPSDLSLERAGDIPDETVVGTSQVWIGEATADGLQRSLQIEVRQLGRSAIDDKFVDLAQPAEAVALDGVTATETVIRGHRAIVIDTESAIDRGGVHVVQITIDEGDGVLTEWLAISLTLDEALAAAESLRPVGASRFDTTEQVISSNEVLYVLGVIPDSFVLREVGRPGSLRRGFVSYLRDVGDAVWLPNDGGFTITSGFQVGGLNEDGSFPELEAAQEAAESHLDGVVTAVAGAKEITIAGHRAVIAETQFAQSGISALHISVLYHDGLGELVEVTSVGLTREDVLALVGSARRISEVEIDNLALSVPWTHRAGVFHDSFAYEVPSVIRSVGVDIVVALGTDLLMPQLFGSRFDQTVVTSEDGSIAPDNPDTELQSGFGSVYLTVVGGLQDAPTAATIEDDPAVRRVELSAAATERQHDLFVEAVGSGAVLSEDPYVVQAPVASDVELAVPELGIEIPIVTATSADVIPTFLFESRGGTIGDVAIASKDRPAVVIGTISSPSTPAPITLVITFMESGIVCEWAVAGEGAGGGCGDLAFGRATGIVGATSGGGSGSVTYSVPPETAIVRILTDAETYWQQPVLGYGLIPFGGSVPHPTEIIALAADGTELGRWEVDDFGF